MDRCRRFFSGVFVFILLFGAMSEGYSQEEFGANFKAIPPKEKEIKVKNAGPSIAPPPKVIPYIAAVLPENKFKVPKNDKVVAAVLYQRNQDLGVYKTSSKTARVQYRDGAYVDGDRIRIYVNYKIVDHDVLLEEDFKGFEIQLEKGVNRIDFEALNEGFAAPNTAEFKVFDDKGVVISASQWNIGQGFMATIIVDRQ